MGREVKRVPMDFDWPMKETWGGYLMPEHLDGLRCPDCDNGGTPAYEWLQGIAAMIGLAGEDHVQEQRGRSVHPYIAPVWDVAYNHTRKRPGVEFAALVDGLASESGGPFGYAPHEIAQSLAKAAGLPKEWGICETCKGSASLEAWPGQLAEADDWERIEPPVGDGWQLWETTSEGSPDSPVFATPEELADWCVDGATVFGHIKADRDRWMKIITGEDFAHITIAPGVVMM